MLHEEKIKVIKVIKIRKTDNRQNYKKDIYQE